MRILSALILIAGLFLFQKSFKLDIYTNEQEFNNQYMSLSGSKDSKKFYELRGKYLTSKFDFQDYGLTFICTGSILVILSFFKLKTPGRKITVILIGVSAALLSIIAYVQDLFLEMRRGGYPHWADSLGIPLMGVPVLIIFSAIWISLNLIGISEPFETGVQIFPLKKGKYNPWYLSILIITVILTLKIIAEGYFWQVIPGFLWIYFYLSILFGKRL